MILMVWRKWRRFARGLRSMAGSRDGRLTSPSAGQAAMSNSIESLAKELVELKPDVLLSRSTPTTVALKRESGDGIPIVYVNVAEPVEQGFVQSLARPGGNITGFTNLEASVGSKMLQLLKEIDPRIVRIVVIYNPQTAPYARSYVRPMEAAAASLGVETIAMPVQGDSDIEAVLTESAR